MCKQNIYIYKKYIILKECSKYSIYIYKTYSKRIK